MKSTTKAVLLLVVSLLSALLAPSRAEAAGKTYTLSVGKSGSGSGTVSSSPAGIDCGAVCNVTYSPDFTAYHADSGKDEAKRRNGDNDHSQRPTALVTLTAIPATGSTFNGWFGACTGTSATCTVTLDQSQNVTANFALMQMTLNVVKTGSGTGGTITSLQTGIDCGANCSSTYDWGTSVTLAVTPRPPARFLRADQALVPVQRLPAPSPWIRPKTSAPTLHRCR